VEQLVALLTIGFGLGAIYALAAVGLALIFRLTGILHFAHGSAMVVGGYTLLGLTQGLGVPFLPAMLVGVAAATLFGPLIYWLAYAPLQRRGVGELGFVITSFGLLIVVQNAVALVFTTTPTAVPAPSWMTTGTITIATGRVRIADIVAVAVGLLAIATFGYLLKRTRSGLILRALEGNPRLAGDLGIRAERYGALVFALGSGLAGVAAVLSAGNVPIAPEDGFRFTLAAYVGMAIGGTRSVWSAAVGGWVLGILSTVPQLWVPQNWNETLAFVVLLFVLIFLPRGIVPAQDGGSDRLRDNLRRLLRRVPRASQEAHS
jgi:branched-chain amino acid transport system permease protein